MTRRTRTMMVLVMPVTAVLQSAIQIRLAGRRNKHLHLRRRTAEIRKI